METVVHLALAAGWPSTRADSRSRTRWARAAAVAAIMLGLAACSSDDSGAGPSDGTSDVGNSAEQDTIPDAPQATDSAEDTASTDSGSGDSTSTPDEESDADSCANCPTGLCVEGECVECVGNESCSFPQWCRDNECVDTLCQGGAIRCQGELPQVCAEDGESWVDQAPCPAETACVQGDCKAVVCEPGDRYCQNLSLWQCDTFGTGYADVGCPPGAACFPGNDQCTPVRPNMLLIFDTSGSMGPAPIIDLMPCICGAGQCPKLPYPACEDTNCPRSRLGLAKKVLLELFASPAFSGVRFAMTRFPQRVSVKDAPSCDDLVGVGNYIAAPSGKMTGDGDYHIAPAGGYFEQNLNEILCVPFPEGDQVDTKALATAWVDSDEVFVADGLPCTKHAECYPDVCAYDAETQVGQCGRHTNPELRPAGGTPIGKSIFYAGEYLRKFVVIDGKPCETDADCKNPNYACGSDNTCFDPLKECRQNIVVLFTDGEETDNTETTDFFNPKVQAKRLRYGLGCALDADCGTGAKCQNTICQGYATPNGGGFELLGLIDGQGANRVEALDGTPITATVHVVDIGEGEGQASNRRIADHGGGVFYPVDTNNPDLLLKAFESALDVKANLKKCIPKFPDAEP